MIGVQRISMLEIKDLERWLPPEAIKLYEERGYKSFIRLRPRR